MTETEAALQHCIDLAGDTLGTEPDLRSVGCVEALATWAKQLSAESIELHRRLQASEVAVGTLQTALRQPWLPIETAPRDGTDLLLWEPSLGHCVIAHSVNGEWPWFYKPTHWMPLPDPPALLPALEPTP